VASPAPLPKKRCPTCGSEYDAAAAFCPKDGAALADAAPGEARDPYLGMVLSGDIEIRSVAGVGAMGTVYRAHQRSIDRDVAVKVLHQELSSNSQLVRRFHREAKIASRLQHPHVVDVHLVGQLDGSASDGAGGGALYIVMEYLDGKSLAAALGDDGRMPLERALGIILQIADAVGEGHALGIVHRDLKPENVMLVRRADVDDWVKVLDFGIARLEIGDQSMETVAGRVMGTARYISPEGAIGAPVGPPGDVYAIATMLYQMLAGRTPFDAAQPIGLLVKHVHEAPPPLASFAPHVPAPIAKVVMENLAKEPEHRAANARAFAAALTAAAKEASATLVEPLPAKRWSGSPPNAPPPVRASDPAELAPTMHDESSAPAIGPLPRPPKVGVSVPSSDAPVERRPPSRGWVGIAAAFAIGVALATLVVSRLNRVDEERARYLDHCRGVLAEGHYIEPPGENVDELVKKGLERWPNDGELQQLRSEAEHEMITMAMAAHGSGDLVGARYLAEGAYRLDPTDNSARFTKAQAEDDLAAIASGTGLNSGPPRLVFESPPVVKTGSKVEMTCRIVVGSAGAKAKVTGIKLTVFPNGQNTGGAAVTLDTTDPANVRATLTAPAVGSWDVSFEASVDGTRVRAMRDLDVTE
jgi:serine/threonine-protein kinase